MKLCICDYNISDIAARTYFVPGTAVTFVRIESGTQLLHVSNQTVEKTPHEVKVLLVHYVYAKRVCNRYNEKYLKLNILAMILSQKSLPPLLIASLRCTSPSIYLSN